MSNTECGKCTISCLIASVRVTSSSLWYPTNFSTVNEPAHKPAGCLGFESMEETSVNKRRQSSLGKTALVCETGVTLADTSKIILHYKASNPYSGTRLFIALNMQPL